jgi:hypothetical protein
MSNAMTDGSPSPKNEHQGSTEPYSTYRLARAFVAVFSTLPDNPSTTKPRLQRLPDWNPTHLVSDDGGAELAFIDAEPPPKGEPRRAGKLTLLVGDDAEWDESRGRSCMANAACIRWDPQAGSLHVLSSIVALPPIFIYRRPGTVAVTSEIRLLRAIAGADFAVNPDAVLDLFGIGYPIEHRTLFKDLSLMPGGHSFMVGARERTELTRAWDPQGLQLGADSSAHLDLQVEAFRDAVAKLRLSDSLFSLTGGLDTRAILAVLSQTSIRPTACTATGDRALSLDARLAQTLCKAYGFRHVVVTLGSEFLKNLPTYVETASRFSGGLASLGQAHEIYFYKQLAGLGSRRLSGNLGNQVGRRGVEGVSLRNANPVVLSDAIRSATHLVPGEHWLVAAARASTHTLTQLLIEREVPFSSVGNYSVGHHFMIQQAPYASRRLIEIAVAAPIRDGTNKEWVPSLARLRDLRHRFLGEPRTQSFQRKVIEQANGVAAECPINWGWRARGGLSVKGLAWGLLAFADAASSRPNLLCRVLQRGLRLVGAEGVHEFKPLEIWFNTTLREYVNDTLRSGLVTGSELFDAATVTILLDEHYRGVRSHYGTLLATLDLALAQQIFSN